MVVNIGVGNPTMLSLKESVRVQTFSWAPTTYGARICKERWIDEEQNASNLFVWGSSTRIQKKELPVEVSSDLETGYRGSY